MTVTIACRLRPVHVAAYKQIKLGLFHQQQKDILVCEHADIVNM